METRATDMIIKEERPWIGLITMVIMNLLIADGLIKFNKPTIPEEIGL